ncbi:MAG: RHS repeat-associated core domain-containing protein [Terriglobia bacterium]
MFGVRRLVVTDRYFFVTRNGLRARGRLEDTDFEVLARVIDARRKVHGFLLTAWVFLSDHGQAVETVYQVYNNYKTEGVFDPAGRELGYYNGVSGAWFDRDLWAAGRMIAQSYPGDTYFLHANRLHSDTQITDYSGAVLTDFVYYPWQVWKYAGSEVDAHFAEFQQSAGANYPTPTRTYSSGQGRWLTPDPDNAGADPANPQTWNAYSYAGNNPTTNTDPSGEDYEVCVNNDNGDSQCTHIQNEAAFKAALANPGPGITVKGGESSGTIYGTDVDGNPVQEGTYKQVTGPGSEAMESGGVSDASAPLVGFVAAGVGLIRSIGADLFGSFFESETPEGGAAGAATVENPVIVPDAPQVTLTEHAAQRAAERGMTQTDIDAAIRTAKETGQVVRQMGKYGTPQNVYKGMNNITVVVETAGRNAGKAITVFRTQ